jgi:hypothetical protein
VTPGHPGKLNGGGTTHTVDLPHFPLQFSCRSVFSPVSSATLIAEMVEEAGVLPCLFQDALRVPREETTGVSVVEIAPNADAARCSLLDRILCYVPVP